MCVGNFRFECDVHAKVCCSWGCISMQCAEKRGYANERRGAINGYWCETVKSGKFLLYGADERIKELSGLFNEICENL